MKDLSTTIMPLFGGVGIIAIIESRPIWAITCIIVAVILGVYGFKENEDV